MSDDRVMEGEGLNRQDGTGMSDASARRRARSAAVVPLVAAAAAVVVCALTPAGRTQTLVSEASVVLLNVIASVSILRRSRLDESWRSSRYFAVLMALLALAATALFVVDLQETAPEARSLDVVFLLFLIPVLGAAREEYKGHFPAEDRREIAIDATLIAASLAAICYALIRPVGADGTGSLSAGTFAIVAATLFAAFGVLALWIPSPAHLLQWLVLTAVSGATLVFGWGWTRGSFDADFPGIVIVFMVAGPAMAAIMAWFPRRPDSKPDERTLHLVRPILTSVSVVSACAALVTVATLDDARGLSTVQSAAIIAILGLGVAARILANQIRSTQAHADARRALGDKERALSEADLALERVREANETLRQSEEHLRLVFEAAVDGIVELDHQRRDPAGERRVLRHGPDRPGVHRRAAVDGARRVGDGSRRIVRLAPGDRAGHDPTVRGTAAVPGVAHLRGPHDAPATPAAGPRRHGRQDRRPDDPLAVQVPAGP